MKSSFSKSKILALALALSFSASLVGPQAVQAEKVLNGSVCAARVSKLTTDLKWQSSIDEAKRLAKEEKKLIFWVNMLGKLEGDTWSAGNSLRAVTLSVDPVFSTLKNDFVCGYTDISNKKYAGASGKHKPHENAVHTTNGAGPHNIQIFVIAQDGTVLHCLPGYWKPEDLNNELLFAKAVGEVWLNNSLTVPQKRQMFAEMNMAHIKEHEKSMAKRSRMQGFDLIYEAKNNPHSDFFYNPARVDRSSGHTPKKNVKTVDIVMHERMAQRPFVNFEHFDADVFSSYGKPMYDKHEQFRLANGSIAPGSNLGEAPMIGNTPKAHPIKTGLKKTGGMIVQTTINQVIRYGMRAIMP